MLPGRISPPEVNREWVLAKCDYFLDTQLWPLRSRLDPEGWLANFEDAETAHAVQLLNSFHYFSEPLVNELLLSAFHTLSRHIGCPGTPLARAQAIWRSFVDEVVITHMTGEMPSTSDSGHVFARRLRDLLRLPDDRVLDPPGALIAVLQGRSRKIVFVDDFVGTGSQFVHTWFRRYRVTPTLTVSFDAISRLRSVQFFLCPVICTEFALNRTIRPNCPNVVVNPAHLLPSCYSALSIDSLVWPDSLRATAREFLRRASIRAGLPETDGTDVHDWQGFHKLGLTIAFSHGVPDATLPIFNHSENGWKPLIRYR